jgi:hypothetical protein
VTRSRTDWFRRRYGASPLHLLGALASFAVIAIAVMGWFAEPAASLKYILIWFGGAIVAHDLLLLPFYSALDRLGSLRRRTGAAAGSTPVRVRGWVYIRVPLIVSAILLLVFGPEIFNQGDSTFHIASGQHQHVYLGRYLAIVAALFALSVLAYGFALTRRVTRRR